MTHSFFRLFRPRLARALVVTLAAISLLALGPWALAPVAASPHLQGGTTTIRCDPTTATGVIGEADVVVDMYVQDIVGLYGVDLRLTFAPAIATVVDKGSATGVQFEALSGFLQPDYVARNTADNTAGTLRYAATQTSPTVPATGSGPVARITFHGLQVGSFTMPWTSVELSDRNGVSIPATLEPCVVRIQSPLAVKVAGFSVSAGQDRLTANWETVSETDQAGFNLLRSELAEGPWTRLNTALIPGRAPGSSQGAAYSWTDEGAMRGVQYFYLLEDVDLHGNTAHHGPVSAALASPNAVATRNLSAGAGLSPPVLAGALVALAALAAGALRARRRGRRLAG